ncbi:MAG: M1 family metallopeptidase [Anaerolineales bacterium]
MPKSFRLLSLLFLLFILAACTSASDGPPPAPTLTADIPAPPTQTATLIPVEEPTAESTATSLPVPERPAYTINAALDYTAKIVTVEQIILYPNHSGKTLNDLVLAVVPNFWASGFTLHSLTVNQTPISNYSLQGQRLEFGLPAPLTPEHTATISMSYTLALPFAEQQDPSVERPRIYGYTDRQVNLVNWYPFIVPYEAGTGWVLHDPWYYGEHLVYEAADYQVILTTDPSVVIAASGYPEPMGASIRYTLTAGRTFAISASPEFQAAVTQIGDVTVTSYYFPFYETPGQAVLDVSSKALQLYSQRFGAYPHRTLTAVMGDFNDGMEYSAFYFLPRDFYNLFDGTPQNYLTFVAAHETAHQWWFERVANDQAQHPWLDETLCTYAERLYYEAYHPNLLNWWWAYRMYYYDPAAWVDITVYQGTGFQPYTNATYFRGAKFLEELRARIGDEAFFAFLNAYTAQMDRKIARPSDFFTVLRQHTSVDFSDLLAAYFQRSY